MSAYRIRNDEAAPQKGSRNDGWTVIGGSFGLLAAVTKK